MAWGTTIRRWVKNRLNGMPPVLRDPVSRMLFGAYEIGVALRRSFERRGRDSLLPLPPPRMRVMVVGHADPAPFLDQGTRHREVIRAAVARAGVEMEATERLLDWGCGCGRVMRWWADLAETEVHGCDYNPKLVRWVNRNLPFAEARVNDLRPPLPYGGGEFDVAYAISIFTHLSNDLAAAWMAEIRRVLQPGGVFFFTTHGRAYRDRLEPATGTRFDGGEPVVLFPEAEGSNLCASYHPTEWVRDRLLEGFELVELREAHLLPPGQLDGLLQDRWLIRKPG